VGRGGGEIRYPMQNNECEVAAAFATQPLLLGTSLAERVSHRSSRGTRQLMRRDGSSVRRGAKAVEERRHRENPGDGESRFAGHWSHKSGARWGALTLGTEPAGSFALASPYRNCVKPFAADPFHRLLRSRVPNRRKLTQQLRFPFDSFVEDLHPLPSEQQIIVELARRIRWPRLLLVNDLESLTREDPAILVARHFDRVNSTSRLVESTGKGRLAHFGTAYRGCPSPVVGYFESVQSSPLPRLPFQRGRAYHSRARSGWLGGELGRVGLDGRDDGLNEPTFSASYGNTASFSVLTS
jgi:hypothetical protein